MSRPLSAALIAVSLALSAPAAQAAFPGSNGRIAFQAQSTSAAPTDLPTQWSAIQDTAVRGRQAALRTLIHCLKVNEQPREGDCSIAYQAPAYSPDGELIAFDAGAQLALMDSDGSSLRILPQVTDDDGEPAFSPDGRKVVFSGRHTVAGVVQTRLYVVVLASEEARPLTRAESSQPSWSLRNRIAFVRDGAVYTMRAGGKGRRRLVTRDGSEPDWSPEGDRLAFVRDGRIFITTLAGKLRRLRGTAAAGAALGGPAWAPSGRRIAFHDALTGIHTIGTDGRGLRLLAASTSGGAATSSAVEPSWQPRGRRGR